MPPRSRFATESSSKNHAVFYDHSTDVRMQFTVAFRDAFPRFRYCQFAEFPIE